MVTGLATNGSYIYGAGVDAQTSPPKEVIERYNLSGAIQSGPFLMTDLGIDFYDIAFLDNEIWYAVDDASEPVQVYNSAGTKTFSLSSSVVPAACGMTFDDEGFLWVSDPDTDLIYKVDLDLQGTAGSSGAAFSGRSVALGRNPSRGAVEIRVTGFESGAVVRVIDLAGRTVARASTTGSMVWDGCDVSGAQVPAGTYLVTASGPEGNSVTTRMVRLQ